jgi:hypothetical protein
MNYRRGVIEVADTFGKCTSLLTSDIQGSISGGGGFADSFYEPAILGWRKKRGNFPSFMVS